LAEIGYHRATIATSDDGLNTVSIDYVRRCAWSIFGRRIHDNMIRTFIELAIHDDHPASNLLSLQFTDPTRPITRIG